jgi:putative ABC transport system permease protein
MTLWSRIRSWALATLCRSRMESEMDAELHFHIEAFAEDLVRSGVSREEATRRARIEFGGVERVKEEGREARGIRLFESIMQDVRHGLRLLIKNPGFSTVAVLTLALGIGANAAIFGLVDSALLRGLPFHEPERLVHVWTTDATGEEHTPSPVEYLALRNDSKAFEQVSGNGWAEFFYGDDAATLQDLPGLLVTQNWLPTRGVHPILGRNFLEDEETAGRDTAVILSYRSWRTRFHGDADIIGRQIVLNRRAVRIVGVLPQSLEPYYSSVEIFAPLVLSDYASHGKLRAGMVRVEVVARLKSGVTLDQAHSEADVIAQQLRGARSSADRSGHLVVESFSEEFRHPGPTRQNARRGLWLMACAAGIVLLVACSNVASLLLARAVKRQREISLRAALGCSRLRMIRQFLTESTLLFLCGGSLGLLLARWSQEIITKVVSGMVSGTYLQIDARILMISLGATFLCALIFGMIPALQATRVNLNDSLKDAASSSTGGSRSRRSRNLLVACQVALGMVLLVSFGLLFRSLLHVESAHLGYDPDNVLTATMRLPASASADSSLQIRMMHEVLGRVRAIPGVESAGITDSLPMEGADSAQLKIERPSPKAAPIDEEIWFLSVSPDYFSTLKVGMFAGRPFLESDGAGSAPVAVINQTFANHYFPGVNPIGYHLALADSPMVWREIVGVVSDFRQRNPEEDLRALAYFPFARTLPTGGWSLALRVRASADVDTTAAELSKSLGSLDPQLQWQLGNLRQLLHDSESLTLRRPLITLLASFGSVALALAIVGVFGVTSYSVSERTREIGVRAALGASPLEISRLVLRETLAVTLAGVAMGTLAALVLTRFLPTGSIGWSGSGIFLYQVSRTDPLTYICAAALLASVALAASWVPARRASHLDPLEALRYE